MRTVRLILLCLLAGISMQAQQSQKASDRVAEIRRLYAEAKELMAGQHVEENANYEMTVTSNHVIPALGPVNETIHDYFGLDDEKFEEDLTLEYHPYFITRSYHLAAPAYYEEYLLDRKTGNLIFYFQSSESIEQEGARNEVRYYWDSSGQKLVHQTQQGTDAASEGVAQHHARRLKEAFQHLVNY